LSPVAAINGCSRDWPARYSEKTFLRFFSLRPTTWDSGARCAETAIAVRFWIKKPSLRYVLRCYEAALEIGTPTGAAM